MLWITDSLIYQQDSIKMKIDYMLTDTLNKNYITTDTLSFNIRRSARDRQDEKKEKEDDENDEIPIQFLGIKTNVQSSFELFNPVRIEFDQPVVAFDSSYVKLSLEVDSLLEPVPFMFEADTLNLRKFTLRPRWEPGGKYMMSVDSATLFNHYGLWNNKYEQRFTVKPLDQYGNLEITISGIPVGKSAFVELMDKTDKPFRKNAVKGNVVRFQDLLPGEIYARIVIDENEDGKWNTGNYEEKRQPEEVFYYPGLLVIRAYSDHVEDWDIHATPVEKQKPLEITKNKPEEKKRRNPNQEREREQQSRQSSPFSGSGSGTGGGRSGGGTPRIQPN